MTGEHSSSGSDWLFGAAVLAVGGLTIGVWAGAELASLLFASGRLNAGFADALDALFQLPQHRRNPALAWPAPAAGRLPGPLAYWACTAAVFAGEFGLVVAGWLRWSAGSRVGTERRRRLGVDVQSRLATRKDLRPLRVSGPVTGRLILGRAAGTLVATELRTRNAGQRRRPREHVGDRSAVAVIGPSRCGKTANLVSGILDWDGPAILSSVKGDLLHDTLARRRTLGEIRVFDPTGVTNHPTCGWSPLQAARTVAGAQTVAFRLTDASPKDGVTNASYFNSKGQELLWPMLFAAAVGHRSMRDVVRWLALQDGNDQPVDPLLTPDTQQADATESEIRTILAARITGSDTRLAAEAKFALQQFLGFWNLANRTRSDIFSTAQILVQAWQDPRVAAASELREPVDLDWLLGGTGANTLYVCQPLIDAERLAVVFGGLMGDLIVDQAYGQANRTGQALPNLLVALDEAGNTPLRWLPQVASTCSGMGIQLVTVWQSKAQIDAIYRHMADAVLTNHGTKIIFAGVSDRATLDYATYLLGDEEVRQRSATAELRGGSGRRAVSDSTIRARLIPADLLRQMATGEALLIHGTLPPAHLNARFWWEGTTRTARRLGRQQHSAR